MAGCDNCSRTSCSRSCAISPWPAVTAMLAGSTQHVGPLSQAQRPAWQRQTSALGSWQHVPETPEFSVSERRAFESVSAPQQADDVDESADPGKQQAGASAGLWLQPQGSIRANTGLVAKATISSGIPRRRIVPMTGIIIRAAGRLRQWLFGNGRGVSGNPLRRGGALSWTSGLRCLARAIPLGIPAGSFCACGAPTGCQRGRANWSFLGGGVPSKLPLLPVPFP